MDSKLLKELIESTVEDYKLVDFDLHFVDRIETNKKIKTFELNSTVTKEQMESLSLYGVNIKEEIVRNMIFEVLMDICKRNSQDRWLNLTEPIKIELYITNWELKEETTEIDFKYKLTLEVAQ